jgi:arginase family enzyme
MPRAWSPLLATIPEGRAVYLTIDLDGLDPRRCRP